MFTPPPSPHPYERSVDISQQNTSDVPFLPESSHAQKRLVGRRIGWTVLLVPLTIILITLSTRHLLHPAAFDVFSNPPTWKTLMSKGLDWTPHKRHPSPDPQAAPSSTTISSSPNTSTDPSSQPIPTIPSSPPVLPTPFPQPFDSDLSQNFTSVSCSSFFINMTNAPVFRTCRPFSLLLYSSSDFIDAQRNYTLMNTLIWGTCNTTTSEEQCVANMGWFASALRSACSQELDARNSMVLGTLTSLQAYGVMRDAACLPDPTTNTFCYLNAVRNPDPTELYFYQLPLGIGLPPTADPKCSPCTASVLGIYAQALSDPIQEVSLTDLKETYESSAALAIQSCGSAYATAIASGGVVALRLKSSLWKIIAVILMACALLLAPP